MSLLSLREIAGNLNLKLIPTKDGVWQAKEAMIFRIDIPVFHSPQ